MMKTDRTAMDKAYEEYKNGRQVKLQAFDLQGFIRNLEYGMSYELSVFRKLLEVLDENNRLLTKKKYRKKVKMMNTGDRGIKRFDLVKIGHSEVLGRVVDISYVEDTAEVCFWTRTFTFDLRFLEKAKQYEIIDADGTAQLG